MRVADVDERVHDGESPVDYVQRLARAKAIAVFESQAAPRAANGLRLLVREGGSDLRLSRSRVRFRPIEMAEIDRYWASGEPCDKAGAYAIQGLGAVFVEALSGSYSGVMGLPLFETATLLVAAGVPVWQAGA